MKLRVRTLLELCLLAGIMLVASVPHNIASEDSEIPVSGMTPPAELRRLDGSMREFMKKWNIPGASVAVIKDHRLIFSRGYGFADLPNAVPVNPESSLFRIASVSKPITAAAVLKLVQDGQLDLDEKVFSILDDLLPPEQPPRDKRVEEITVRDCLNMSAGWDKDRSGDPILQPYISRAAKQFHIDGPADFDATARYVLRRKLDFKPGSKFAYSNFTYGLLGKIIEKKSGKDYASYCREALFQPAEVELHKAHTRQEDSLPGEVCYYAPFEPEVRSFLPTPQKRVPAPYARAYMEADVPMLGWVATAPQLARLMDRLLTDENVLANSVRGHVYCKPQLGCWQGSDKFFSMGWEVRGDRNSRFTVFKDGTLPGTRAFVEHTPDGLTWVALFNARPPQKRPDKFGLQIKRLMATNLDYVCVDNRRFAGR